MADLETKKCICIYTYILYMYAHMLLTLPAFRAATQSITCRTTLAKHNLNKQAKHAARLLRICATDFWKHK